MQWHCIARSIVRSFGAQLLELAVLVYFMFDCLLAFVNYVVDLISNNAFHFKLTIIRSSLFSFDIVISCSRGVSIPSQYVPIKSILVARSLPVPCPGISKCDYCSMFAIMLIFMLCLISTEQQASLPFMLLHIPSFAAFAAAIPNLHYNSAYDAVAVVVIVGFSSYFPQFLFFFACIIEILRH